MSQSTEVLVIGGGPGGYTAAFYAADMGKKVTLVEKDNNLGGVCLNVGCIPSKALLHLAALKEEAEAVDAHGISFGKAKIDIDKVRSFKESVIGKMTGGLKGLAKARKVEVMQGTARFTGSTEVEIATKEGGSTKLSFEKCIIAVGSRPVVPGAFDIGSDRVMDSTGALELKDIPKRLLIVGGGVIGLEMGNVYASFGSEVTVIEALPNLAMGADRDVFKPLENKLKKQFKNILTNTMVEKLEKKGDTIEVSYKAKDGDKSEKAVFDRVLLSIGRRPNSENLGLENTAVKVSERGFIEVDNQLKTSDSNIFAIGDVVGNPMLAHKAAAEGKVAVDAILDKKTVFEPLGIPSVIYTDPEVAWVGLTEQEAKEKDVDIAVSKFPWAALGRATALGKTDGLTKIIFDPKTERVLGVAMSGVGAGEMIAEGALALEMGAVAEDLAGTIHAHPTISESMMESAEALHGLATSIYAPKRH